MGLMGDAAVGAAIGLVNNQIANLQQLGQQDAFSAQQMNYSKQLTKFNNDQAYQMWLKTNYAAQIREMKRAGVSPGLMMKQGGPGGTLQNNAGTVTGGTAPNNSMALLNASMIAAQIKNIEADTKQKQANTQKTETVDTQETVTRIEKLAQETTNLKGQKVLMDIETWMKKIDSAIKEDTARDMVDKIHYEAQEQIAKAEMAFTDNYIKNETYESTIEAIRENAIGAMLQNRATILGFDKTSAEIQKIQTEITRMVNQTANEIRGLDQKDKELKIKEFDAWIKAHYPQVQQVMGYNINKLLVMQDQALEKIYGKYGKRDTQQKQ